MELNVTNGRGYVRSEETKKFIEGKRLVQLQWMQSILQLKEFLMK